MSRRIYAEPTVQQAHYHVFSRVVNRDFVLGDDEREQFRRILSRLLRFCGLEAVTWCCLSNHFHILLTVPGEFRAESLREKISEAQLFERMKLAFSDQYIREVQWRVNHARHEMRNEAWALDIINRLKAQMFDLSKFMHMLKRRFSAWFNQKHGRRGTLWEERFGSVLVEDSDALRTMAAYIDLNPVRAGLVDDPKDYRWCGYAEALAGNRRARNAIQQLLSNRVGAGIDWRQASELYRSWLVEGGAPRDQQDLSRVQLLRCRIRYFTAGAVIGSRKFVDQFFQANRARFGPKRKTGARPMRHGDWNGLCSLRDLRIDPVKPP